MLTYSAQVFVYFPGGFGTLDEFSEIVTLIQTKKIPRIPVVLVGREFWQPMYDWMNGFMNSKNGAIDPDDLQIFTIVDTAEEVMEIVRRSAPRDTDFD